MAAGESANIASIGGALIPLITMGIPGSATEAILIGALTIHNLQPGPLLFQNAPEIAYGIIAAYLVAKIFVLVMMWSAVRYNAKVVNIPRAALLSVILVFCVVGSYAVNNSFAVVLVMIAFGVIGFVLKATKVPLGPFVIGFVLSPIVEEQLRASFDDGRWQYGRHPHPPIRNVVPCAFAADRSLALDHHQNFSTQKENHMTALDYGKCMKPAA